MANMWKRLVFVAVIWFFFFLERGFYNYQGIDAFWTIFVCPEINVVVLWRTQRTKHKVFPGNRTSVGEDNKIYCLLPALSESNHTHTCTATHIYTYTHAPPNNSRLWISGMGPSVPIEYHRSSTNGEILDVKNMLFYISYVCLTMSNTQKLK